MIRLCRTLVSIVFVISILAIILILSPGINAHAQEANDFAGGNGTEEDPYLVATAEHLDNVRKHLDAHFKQIADIDLSEFAEGEGWVPIGFLNPWGRSEGFTGSYDGNGFRISNLTIEKPDFWAIGMFGYLEGNAILKNITLENVNVAGWMVSGGLVGLNGSSDDEEQNPSIENCSVNGKVVVSDTSGVVGGLVGGLVGGNYGQINGCLFTGKVEGERTTGGLVGVNENGNITDSFAEADVSGERTVGGLVGVNEEGIVSGSYFSGKVKSGIRAGGLVGVNNGDISSSFAQGEVTAERLAGGLAGRNSGSIEDCYARGNISGDDRAGGLIALNMGNISNSYAACHIKGEEHVGGIVGQNEGAVEDSYYDKDVAGLEDGPGKPKSTEEMMRRETFENWDFEEIWAIDEGETYPYLKGKREDQKDEDVH